jgi:hypothetical protein
VRARAGCWAAACAAAEATSTPRYVVRSTCIDLDSLSHWIPPSLAGWTRESDGSGQALDRERLAVREDDVLGEAQQERVRLALQGAGNRALSELDLGAAGRSETRVADAQRAQAQAAETQLEERAQALVLADLLRVAAPALGRR